MNYLRKIIFSLILLSWGSGLIGQKEWAPIGAEWYYTFGGAFGPPISYVKLTSKGDTILGGKSCRLLTSEVFQDSLISYSEEIIPQDYIIYQDSNKIYRWEEETFHILYDFDLQVGDTIKIYIPDRELFGPEYDDQHVYFEIDSVDTETINGESFKRQKLKYLDMGIVDFSVDFSDWAYEVIGSRSFFVPISFFNCDNACATPMRCYSSSDGFSYNRFGIPCDTVVYRSTSTMEENTESIARIFPNPVESDLYLETEDPITEIAIIDVMGNSLLRETFPIEVYHHNVKLLFLPPGIYYLIVSIGDVKLTRKILKL